jgi:hypothetical protein
MKKIIVALSLSVFWVACNDNNNANQEQKKMKLKSKK